MGGRRMGRDVIFNADGAAGRRGQDGRRGSDGGWNGGNGDRGDHAGLAERGQDGGDDQVVLVSGASDERLRLDEIEITGFAQPRGGRAAIREVMRADALGDIIATARGGLSGLVSPYRWTRNTPMYVSTRHMPVARESEQP